MHRGVAFAFFVLGRAGRGDERRVHQGAFAQQQAARGEVRVDRSEEGLAQIVGLEQTAELKQGGRVGDAPGLQLDAGEALQRLAVVEGVFQRLVGQRVPLLEEIDPQHPLQPDGRATARTLRVVRRDDREQLRPRDHLLHPREEPLSPGALLLRGKLGVRKCRLVRHAILISNQRASPLRGLKTFPIKSASP